MMILGTPSAFAAFLAPLALNRFNRTPIQARAVAPPRSPANSRVIQMQAPLPQNIQTFPQQSYDPATLNLMSQLAAAQATVNANSARRPGTFANFNAVPATPVNAANLASATGSSTAAMGAPNSSAVNVASPPAAKKFSVADLEALLTLIQAIQQPPAAQQPQTVQQSAVIQQPAAVQQPVVIQQSPGLQEEQIREYLINDLV